MVLAGSHRSRLGVKDRLDVLDFVPSLEVVLRVDRVLSAAPIVPFRMIRDGYHRLLHTAASLFQTFRVDHCVGTFVAGPMARTLITNVEVLLLLF